MNWYKKLCPEGFEKPSSLFTSKSKRSVVIKDELLTQTSTLNESGGLAKMPISLSQQQLDNIHLVLEGGESTKKSGKHRQHTSAVGSVDKINQIGQICKLTGKQSIFDNELHPAPSSISGSSKSQEKNDIQRVPSIISLGSYDEDTYGFYSNSKPETLISGGIYHAPFQPDIQQGVALLLNIDVIGESPCKTSNLNYKLKCKRLKLIKKSALAAWKEKAFNALSQECDNTIVSNIFGLDDDGNIVIHVFEDIAVTTGLEVEVKSGLKKYFMWRMLKAREMKQNTKLKTVNSIIKRLLKSLRAAFKGNIFHNHLHKTLLLNHP